MSFDTMSMSAQSAEFFCSVDDSALEYTEPEQIYDEDGFVFSKYGSMGCHDTATALSRPADDVSYHPIPPLPVIDFKRHELSTKRLQRRTVKKYQRRAQALMKLYRRSDITPGQAMGWSARHKNLVTMLEAYMDSIDNESSTTSDSSETTAATEGKISVGESMRQRKQMQLREYVLRAKSASREGQDMVRQNTR